MNTKSFTREQVESAWVMRDQPAGLRSTTNELIFRDGDTLYRIEYEATEGIPEQVDAVEVEAQEYKAIRYVAVLRK